MSPFYTPFISYQNINVEEIDLYEDAWGFNSEFNEVIEILNHLEIVPGEFLTNSLIDKIRKQEQGL